MLSQQDGLFKIIYTGNRPIEFMGQIKIDKCRWISNLPPTLNKYNVTVEREMNNCLLYHSRQKYDELTSQRFLQQNDQVLIHEFELINGTHKKPFPSHNHHQGPGFVSC